MRKILCSVLLATSLGLVRSQDVASFHFPKVELDDAEARQAIAWVFKNTGTHVVIHPDVRGRITYAGEPKTFEVFLREILRPIDCTYRVNNGRFEIIKTDPSGLMDVVFPERLAYYQPTFVYDDKYVYTLERESLSMLRREDGVVERQVNLVRTLKGGVYDLSTESGRKGIKEAGRLADVRLEVAPEKKGTVRIRPGPATYDRLMADIASTSGEKLQMEHGEPMFLRQILPGVWLNLFSLQRDHGRILRPRKLKVNGQTLEVQAGNWKYKVRKTDLTILSWSALPLRP